MAPSPPRSSKPDVELSSSPEEPALIAAAASDGRGSFSRSLGHVVSWAGGHAMRPQAAMAAVLLLMLGSSLIFLRGRPEQGATARVSVIERGIPDRRDELAYALVPQPLPTADLRLVDEPVRELGRGRTEPAAMVARHALTAARAPRQEEPPSAEATPPPSQEPAAAAEPVEAVDPYAAAMALYRGERFAEAARDFDEIAASSAKNAPLAALYAAKSVQAASGCSAAVSKYESVAARFENSNVAGDALWGAASCHKTLGNFKKARELYLELRQVAGYRDRAEQEIKTLDTIAP